MDRSTPIYLIGVTKTQDNTGVWRQTETKRKVYCNVKSASAKEFFEGGRNGLNPSFTFTMFSYDYHDEPIVEYENNRYSVYRVFRAKTDILELHVERKGGTV